MSKRLAPIAPGEVLLEEFLKPAGISPTELAQAIKVPPARVSKIVRGKRGIDRDMAARLAVYFGTSPDLWINLQARFDTKIAETDLMSAIQKLIGRRTHAA